MKQGFFKRNIPTLFGVIIGGIGGYLYWKYVGCASGTCPITSSAYLSSLWGGLIGGLLFNGFNNQSDEK